MRWGASAVLNADPVCSRSQRNPDESVFGIRRLHFAVDEQLRNAVPGFEDQRTFRKGVRFNMKADALRRSSERNEFPQERN